MSGVLFGRNIRMSAGHHKPEPGARPSLAGGSGTASDAVDFSSRAHCPIPLIGIGASAGGMKAFFSAAADTALQQFNPVEAR
jgi:hypothetical protein